MNTVEIPLTQGMITLIDVDDFELVKKHKWCAWPVKRNFYAGTKIRNKTVYMHRLILGATRGKIVDHMNRNRLDNRRCNLRFCTPSQNNQNQGGYRGGSQYKGIYWHKGAKKWAAQIKTETGHKYLGLYEIEKEAALAYNNAAKKYFGEFAKLNEIET